MRLDFRYSLVGEGDLVPDAPSPLIHDGLAGEGFHAGILILVRRQVKIAQGNGQRLVEDQLIIGHGPRKTHRITLQSCRGNKPTTTHQSSRSSGAQSYGGTNDRGLSIWKRSKCGSSRPTGNPVRSGWSGCSDGGCLVLEPAKDDLAFRSVSCRSV